MGEGHRLGGALLIKDLAAVPAVVLPVGEGERRTAAKADVRVDPFWCGLRVDHSGISHGKVLWWEFIT
jgi:hypothetical protein